MKQNKIYLLFTNTGTLFTRTIRYIRKQIITMLRSHLILTLTKHIALVEKSLATPPSMVDLSKKK
ncbi:hypothetical protein [Gracilibacillus sp. JCM 18860]|uniref:hypothetical protein n=1 Tax=Gracilibacillus sp. JCM 18860 TaxID=1306159 RepID=UPI000AB66758